MATINDAIEEIQTLVGEIAGIRSAPAYPPEDNSVFPFALAYPGSGSVETVATQMRSLHDISIELHISRKDLPRDMETAIAYVDDIPDKLLGYLGSYSYIDTMGIISYEFATFVYGSVETVGYIFTLNDVKIMQDYS